MKTKTILSSLAALALSGALLRADPLGTAFTYQGRLTDGGQPANGLYTLFFALYNAPSDGDPVAIVPPTNGVPVSNGLFTVSLDFGPAVFGGEARWLQISVATNGSEVFTLLTPRQRLTPTPQAIFSVTALGASNLFGTLTDAQLPASVARLDANQTFTGTMTFDPAAGPPFIIPPHFTNVVVTNLTAGDADTVDGKHAKDFWQLKGNAGTTAGNDYLGTSDQQPLEFKVNNNRVLRFEPNAASPNVLAGHSGNFIQAGVAGGTISGGGTAGGTNQVLANYGTIGGGEKNTVADVDSTIGGGQQNAIPPGAFKSVVGGGALNVVGSKYSVISGGNNCQIGPAGDNDSILGGGGNLIEGPVSGGTIGGGLSQHLAAQANSATIAGGQNNVIWSNAQYAAIGGGFTNVIGTNAFYATIPGGVSNQVNASYGFAAGRRAKAGHQGSFVWADSTDADFASTTNNQFLIRAGGGVGINKNNPATALDVNGTVTAANFTGSFQGSGSGLTNVSAGSLSGLVPTASLGGVYPGLIEFPNTGNSFAGSFSGNGSGLTALPAANLVGTLPAPALSGTYSAPLMFPNPGNDVSGIFHGGFYGNGGGLTNLPSVTNVLGGYWRLIGNANTGATNFLGTTDSTALELKVNSARALRLEPNATSPNVIGGFSANGVGAGFAGVTISGGGNAAEPNQVSANYGTVGGGRSNVVANSDATIAGGRGNQNSASYAAIGGGTANTILPGADYSTIGGGDGNIVHVNSQQATIGGGTQNTIQPSASADTIGGGNNNTIESFCNVSTIGGGNNNQIKAAASESTLGGGLLNAITASLKATIAGGFNNLIQSNAHGATIAGGQQNLVDQGAHDAAIGGGLYNTVAPSSPYGTIPGGYSNQVAAPYGMAAGNLAQALHQGAFVWADSQNATFASTAPDQASFRCQGGVRFTSGAGGANQTVLWAPGLGGWMFTSDRAVKEDFTPVDAQAVLDKVSRLPITEWNYRGFPQRHIGPMAQDFHAQFPLNDCATMLNEADLHGVALAAIQGLNQKVEASSQESDARSRKLEAKNAALEKQVVELKTLVKTLAQKVNGGGL